MCRLVVLGVKNGSQNHAVIVGKGSNTQNAEKPKNLCELKDFSGEQQIVELFRTNKGLMNNYH